jgi:hypothetical protein
MTSLLLLAALGCTNGEPASPDSGRDTSDRDSASVDSATDSGDSGSAVTETGDSTPQDMDPGILALAPREMVVDPGASWTLRAVHILGGEPVDVATEWESSDPSVVTLSDDGTATAISPGQATLTARFGDLHAHASVTVQATPLIRVQLIQAEDGLPLTQATVFCNGETVPVDPLTGVAELVVPAGESVWLTGLSNDDSRIPTTLMDVVGRQVILPMRTRGQVDPDGEIQGTFDFSGLPPLSDDEKAAGWVVLGIAGGSLRMGPLFWRADEVLSPNRDVELLGLNVSVPGNLAIYELFEEWIAPAWSGDAGVWSMAGPVPLAEAILGLSSLDDALNFLLTNMDGFVYDFDGDLVVPVDEPLLLEVAPLTALSEVIEVELPEWPEGFARDNPATLVALDGDGPAGPTVVGFGRGFAGTNHLSRVPGSFFGWDGSASQVLAYLEVGGLGSLGPRVLQVAPVVDGVAVIPPFQDPPAILDWDEPNLILELSVDPDVGFVYLHLSNRSKDERDYYMRRPDGPVTLTFEGPEMGMGTLTFEVGAVETTHETYGSLLAEGKFLREDLTRIARSTGFLSDSFKVD